jgi:hypothetical protein
VKDRACPSISWAISTQEHSGTIEVDNRIGEFNEFSVRRPRSCVVADRKIRRLTMTIRMTAFP